jgi:predicted unusual protein kinase regulating ubiquinone biosynthesis (AarF/ABC1/UbiB family)
LNLSPHTLKRRLEISRLLLKYGRSDLIQVMGLDEHALREDTSDEVAGDPAELARDLEAMGPTFIKGGQMLSTRPDLLAAPYITSLERLQDQVEPISFGEIERIVEEDLGVRLSKAFSAFDATPLGAASLSQVHAARLRDGREVAVKVQRPGVREEVLEDLEILGGMVDLAERHTEAGRRYGFAQMFEEFRHTMVRELDLRREAQNLTRVGEFVQEYPLLIVPAPIASLSSSRVLTMERVHGRNLGQISGLARLGLDGEVLAESLLKAYLDLILVHGCFNADPHPGNLLLTDDGRLALIDMGMVAYLSTRTRETVLRLLMAVSDAEPDACAELVISLGERLEDFDEFAFKRAASELLLTNQDVAFGEAQLGRMVLEMVRVSASNGLRPSPDLTMLGKTLLNLDRAAQILAPELKPSELIRDHGASLMRRHLLGELSPGRLFTTALETNELIQRLPARLNSILGRLADRDLELKVHAFDEDRVIAGLQKIANRITLGLVVAALIVGAALMMRVPSDFQLFGYPGLAISCFVAAAAVGVGLVASILFTDHKQ